MKTPTSIGSVKDGSEALNGDIADILLPESQLANRWDCSIKKLQADRLKGDGPAFIKIGRLVRYHIEDIVAYEKACRHTSTSREG